VEQLKEGDVIAKVVPYHPAWDIIDSSKIGEDFLHCKRKYFFANILGWTGVDPSIHLVFGESWHRAQEVLLINKYHPESILPAMERFEEYYREFFSPTADDIHYPKTPGRALEALVQYVKTYGATDSNNWECLHTEIAGAAPLLRGKKIYFRLDSILRNRLNNKILSREHKTGSRLDNKWRDKWILAIQMGTYTHVLFCVYPPEDVLGISINGAIFRKNDTEFVRVPVNKTPAMMEAWLADMDAYLAEIDIEMEKLAMSDPDKTVLHAFPRNPRNCMDYYGCKFHPYCCAWPNPLRNCESPPQGMKVEFWNPMEREHKKTIDFEGREVKEVG